jgi:hypothetical protein
MTNTTVSVRYGSAYSSPDDRRARMDLRVTHGRVILPGDPSTHAEILAELRAGTFAGTVAGTQVIGIDGIAALTGLQPESLHSARYRAHRRGGRRPRDLPEPVFRVEHRGAVINLFDLAAVLVWAGQTGKLRPAP